MTSISRRRVRGSLVPLLATVLTTSACSNTAPPQAEQTCQATGQLLEALVDAAESSDADISSAVQRVVDATMSSGDPRLQETADRLVAAWEDSLADREAAPTMDFGRAVGELREECVDRGFAYPDLGVSGPGP